MTKSLYIHIPFCHDICGYCDFVRVGYHKELADRYLLELRKDLLSITESISSIYIGGGTPSSLTLDQLELLFDSLKHLIKDDIEITFEANPESLSEDKIKLLVNVGVNRISLGAQSTQQKFLDILGRKHSFNDVINVMHNCQKHGLANISLDLMYGVPKQTMDDLKSDLKALIDLNPNHISLYSLTIEPDSQFGRLNIPEVESELETQMYLLIHKTLSDAGYEHYEISNFCKPGFKSQHNLSYWNYSDFIGVGIGASGKENHWRYTNDRHLNSYLNHERIKFESIKLSPKDEIFEHLMMNLRLNNGINIENFNRRHQIDILDYFDSVIKEKVKTNLLSVDSGYLKATEVGRLMLHDILVDFME